MGILEGRVAVITGGARGQGRSHALALAREGADIAFCDLPEEVRTLPYATASESDMADTMDMVEDLGRRCVARQADARDPAQMAMVMETAAEKLGKIDILVVNHGICSYFELKDMPDDAWQDMIDVNLTGTFNAVRAVLPYMRERQYGRIVLTSSGLARQGQQTCGHYIASKWGILGLAKSVALEVAQEGITVNAILPTTVETPMIMHDAMYRLFRPDLESPTAEDMKPILSMLNAQGIPWVQPEAVSEGVLFLVSDRASHLTGGGIDIGAGWNARSSS